MSLSYKDILQKPKPPEKPVVIEKPVKPESKFVHSEPKMEARFILFPETRFIHESKFINKKPEPIKYQPNQLRILTHQQTNQTTDQSTNQLTDQLIKTNQQEENENIKQMQQEHLLINQICQIIDEPQMPALIPTGRPIGPPPGLAEPIRESIQAPPLGLVEPIQKPIRGPPPGLAEPNETVREPLQGSLSSFFKPQPIYNFSKDISTPFGRSKEPANQHATNVLTKIISQFKTEPPVKIEPFTKPEPLAKTEPPIIEQIKTEPIQIKYQPPQQSLDPSHSLKLPSGSPPQQSPQQSLDPSHSLKLPLGSPIKQTIPHQIYRPPNVLIDEEPDEEQFYRYTGKNKFGQKLVKALYPDLDRELNKIRALMSFKNNLVDHVIRYFKSHNIYHGNRLRYIRTQIYNHFPNWFFNANLRGEIQDFVPTQPLIIQENLDYIFQDNHVNKIDDFDQKLLSFNEKFVNDELQVREIQIVQKTEDEYIHYELINNGPVWKLLPMTSDQYLSLKRRYSGGITSKFHEHLSIILLRYKFLGGINNHLSIPPHVYQKLGIEHELFGSPFNVSTLKYCSPFPDYEQYFGSLGSFVNYSLQSNTIYSANPPFDVQVILTMAEKFERELANLKQTTIIITIPLWRDDFPAHEIMKKSRFFKDQAELNRERYPFFHYFKKQMIPASDTFLIILSTETTIPFNCHDIQSIW